MGVHDVCLNVWIDLDDDLVAPVHRGASLVPRFCPHDIVRKFRLKVSMCQWTHVVRHCQSFVILAARLDGVDSLDVSRDFSGVVCKSSDRTPMDRDALQCMELFCGAFSGWSQVLDACQNLGYTCDMRLAADISPECIVAYQRTFCDGDDLVVGPWNFDVPGNDLPDRCLVETDIRNYRWTYLTGCYVMDFCVASPPCQPWSRANKGPGLLSSDGGLLLDTIGLARIIRPRVLAIELVSGLVQHAHFRQVKDFLRFCGYALKWCQLLNLKEILPQNRERVLMIAIRAGDVNLNPHICVSWPLHLTPSLHDSSILRSFDGYPVDWVDAATVVPEVLQKYMDPSLLPHAALLGNDSAKRSKVAVEAYRIRHPHDIFSCIMASYGSAHEMPVKMLQTFGLYGSMVCFEGALRFLTIPEILTLQGLLCPIWLRGSVKTIVHQLGNAIATPHACIAIMNMLGFVRLLDGVEVQRLFNVVIQQRMSIRHMSWNVCDYGWWFTVDDFAIPPTVPLHEFTDLVISYNEEKVCIRCERGLDVWNVLLVVLELRGGGPSDGGTSREVRLEPRGNLPPPPPPPPKRTATDETKYDVFYLDAHHFEDAIDFVIQEWMRSPMEIVEFRTVDFLELQIDRRDGMIFWVGRLQLLLMLNDAIKKIGVEHMLNRLGWCFAIQFVSAENIATGRAVLFPKPVGQVVSRDLILIFMQFVFLKYALPRWEEMADVPGVWVKVKMHGAVLYSTLLPEGTLISDFHDAWDQSCNLTTRPSTIRIIINGKQASAEFKLLEYSGPIGKGSNQL